MYKSIIRPILFRFSSDVAHEATVKWAERACGSQLCKRASKLLYNYQSPALKQEILSMTFRNPVGLAAGFDKNGSLTPIMDALGFGFVEVGSITAKASPGNPKPRSFRLLEDESLINRMGLNNDGAATIVKRLKKQEVTIPIGVNIAKTHDPAINGEKALDDYHESFRTASEIADYITLNISCPNTREGKTFEEPETYAKLLNRLQISSNGTLPPVFVKFSVDLEQTQLVELIEISKKYSISGFIAVNTSVKREGLLTGPNKLEEIGSGGLSGKAIREKSNRLIRTIFEETRGEKPIIGVGGIFGPEDAIEKLQAGADLLQVYTGLVYEGPALVKRINKGIVNHLAENNLEHIYQIR